MPISLGGFLSTHKEADLAPYPVVGFVLQVGDAEKFTQTFDFEGLDPFFQSAARYMFHSHRGARVMV